MAINLSGIVPVEKLANSNLTVCFTGPRPKNLHGYVRDPYRPIVDFTEQICSDFVQSGVRTFISGGAQGFDQLAFWAVERLRRNNSEIKNNIYIPFKSQPSVWSAQGTFSQADYRLMVKRANSANVLSPDPANAGEAARRLHTRNHTMVRDSDIVIALLADRSLNWEHAKGGTAECVRHAHSVGKPIFAIEYRPGNSPDTVFQTRLILA